MQLDEPTTLDTVVHEIQKAQARLRHLSPAQGKPRYIRDEIRLLRQKLHRLMVRRTSMENRDQ